MMSDITQVEWLTQRRSTQLLSHQLAELLRDAIRSGKLAPGKQLPSENDFAKQLGVSRTTLRDAIILLLGEGLIERRRGLGTFVTTIHSHLVENNIASMISTTS